MKLYAEENPWEAAAGYHFPQTFDLTASGGSVSVSERRDPWFKNSNEYKSREIGPFHLYFNCREVQGVIFRSAIL